EVSFAQVTFLADPTPNQTNLSSRIGDIVEYNGKLYFNAFSQKQSGLWTSDGTTGGTELVALTDQIFELASTANGVVFTALNYDIGLELWFSDGTATGTYLLKDIVPGYRPSNPQRLTTVGDRVFFLAATDSAGVELWQTDGTATGTQMVKDINPGPGDTRIQELIPYKDGLAFTIFTPNQLGLWYSDGTDAGTNLITHSITNPTLATFLKQIDQDLYFTTTSNQQIHLWRTNLQQTDSLVSLGGVPLPTINANHYFRFQNDYYYHQHSFDGADTLRLFRTDSAFSTRILVQEFPTTITSINALHTTANRIIMNLRYLFNGSELWSSDGNTAQFVFQNASTTPRTIAKIDSILLLDFFDGQIYRTNGTTAGTYSLGEFFIKQNSFRSPSRSSIQRLGNQLYMYGYLNGASIGDELYATDLSNGISLVKDVEPAPLGANLNQLTPLGDKMIFTANSFVGNNEIWVSEGDSASTLELIDPTPGFEYFSNGDSIGIGSNPTKFLAHNGQLYFAARDSFLQLGIFSYFYRLWRTDGTPSGTQRLDSIEVVVGNSVGLNGMINRHNHIIFNNKIIFGGGASPSSPFGLELYSYDLSTNQTELLADIYPGMIGSFSYSSIPQHFTVVGNEVFMVANSENEGNELWKTDGTSAGTQMVK
ncbi:MAG: hypothetical protein AAFQ87_23055, partial [Bacteroidota bacterium]